MKVLFQCYGVLQGRKHLYGATEGLSSELLAFYEAPSARLIVSDIQVSEEWVTVTRAAALSGVNTEWTEILFPSPEAAKSFAETLKQQLTNADAYPPKQSCEDMFDEIFGPAETINL